MGEGDGKESKKCKNLRHITLSSCMGDVAFAGGGEGNMRTQKELERVPIRRVPFPGPSPENEKNHQKWGPKCVSGSGPPGSRAGREGETGRKERGGEEKKNSAQRKIE